MKLRHEEGFGLITALMISFVVFILAARALASPNLAVSGQMSRRPIRSGRRAPETLILTSPRRTSPVVFAGTHDDRAAHAGAGGGCGRSSAISRRISANSILEMATSAIWKVT